MRGSKGILVLVLLLAIALVASVPAGSAAGTSGNNAVVAKKKKCKKKKPHAAKKKECKKKKKKKATPTSVVRATLTWTGAGSDDADLDLFVFDAQGARAGNGSDSIPASQLSPDVHGRSGSETFTDLEPSQHRGFSYGVCYQVGGSVHAPFTITFSIVNGQTHSLSRDPGSSFHYDFPADGVPIPTAYCPD